MEITEEQYMEVLGSGKSTAPGEDQITKKILRDLPLDIHQYIIRIYKFCINRFYIPENWKDDTIITIAKQNADPSHPSSYRPITLLSVLAKNLEKIIKKFLFEAVGRHIARFQFGF